MARNGPALAALVASVALLPPARAGAAGDSWAAYGQFTYVEQDAAPFRSPYRGRNSLSPHEGRETVDATLFAGVRLGSQAELWVNPEIDQGAGLDDTVGAAGFPSGEAYKVGRNQPYLRLPRAFVRATLDLGEDREPVEAGPNQFAGARSADRIVLTAGKFSVVDLFDVSAYAHDPRGDFLNWAAIDTGSFDYAADAWGYTVGAALEWYRAAWTLRGGWFDLSTVPNTEHLDPGGHEFQWDLELEHRHEFLGRAGKILLTAFDSRGRMARLDLALGYAALTGRPVAVAPVRQYGSRPGVDLTLDQQLAADLGAFARAGVAAGNVEAYEFSDIDRTLAVGLSLKGARWRRPADTIGVALIANGISAARQAFLAAGGLGILVGDGRLPHPGPERILETYYRCAVLGAVSVTLDYQWIGNPAYNRDRGPASVYALRVHAEL